MGSAVDHATVASQSQSATGESQSATGEDTDSISPAQFESDVR